MGKKQSEIENIKLIFSQRKTAFEIIGIFATVTALFLQVQIDNNSLKYIQSLLVLILAVLISISVISLWHSIFIKHRKETPISISISMIYSGIAVLFIIHLFKFSWEVFNTQIIEYLIYTKLGVCFLIYFLSYKFLKKSKNQFISKILPELIWLLTMVFIFNINYLFDSKYALLDRISLIIFLALMGFNNLLSDSFKLYSQKKKSLILGIIAIITIIVILLL